MAAINVNFDSVCHCWLVQQWNSGTSATLLGQPAVAPVFRKLIYNGFCVRSSSSVGLRTNMIVSSGSLVSADQA